MKFLVFISLIIVNSFALQIKSFDKEVINGKTAIITLEKQKGIEYKNISLDKKKFPIITSPLDKQCCFALIPVSYYEQASSKELYIHYLENKKEKSTLLFLDIQEGNYAHEELKVQSSKVNPTSKKVKERIEKEYTQAMKVYNTTTPKLYISKPFDLPMDSNITSDFGKARVYNGSLNGYHSGTDFRAQVGTKIKASNDGKVVMVAERFYSGGTVVLDHGYGIYTCYFHMSKFNVKKGQLVHKGELLGLSGQSGRVTGPHLHFAARVEGVQVDPLQLITLLNNNILKDTK